MADEPKCMRVPMLTWLNNGGSEHVAALYRVQDGDSPVSFRVWFPDQDAAHVVAVEISGDSEWEDVAYSEFAGALAWIQVTSDTLAADTEMSFDWVATAANGEFLGGRIAQANQCGACPKWYLKRDWWKSIRRIHHPKQSEWKTATAGMMVHEEGQDAWPTTSPTQEASQFGFDTRVYHFRPLPGSMLQNGLQVKSINGSVVDEWSCSSGQFNGSFALERVATVRITSSTTSSGTTDPERATIVFQSTPLMAGLPSTTVKYTHTIRYDDTKEFLGYLQIVKSGTMITGQKWYVNDAVAIGLGKYAINPLRNIEFVAGGGTATLSSGTWYSTYCTRA